MSGTSGHIMFAECFRDIRDDELLAEYERVLGLPPSNWRTAVINEAVKRTLASPSTDPEN